MATTMKKKPLARKKTTAKSVVKSTTAKRSTTSSRSKKIVYNVKPRLYLDEKTGGLMMRAPKGFYLKPANRFVNPREELEFYLVPNDDWHYGK